MTIKLEFPPGTEIDRGFLEFAQQAFTAAGISQQQAMAIAGAWQGFVTERVRTDTLSHQAAAEREVELLKNTWGKDFDADIASGKKAVRSLGMSNAELDALERSVGLAPVMSMFARLGRHMSAGGAGPATPEQAAKTIEQLKGDKEFQASLRDRRDPKHAENLRTWEIAHSAAFPAKETAPVASEPPRAATAKPAGGGSREQAKARIMTLLGDADFQSRMRQPGPHRAGAVAEWEGLHAQAHASQGDAQ